MKTKFLNLFSGDKKVEKDIKDQTLVVKKNRCPQNHPCPSVRVCPVGALSQKGNDAPEIDMKKCIKCGNCVSYCPMGALKLE